MLDLSNVASKDPEEAWAMLIKADAEGDLDDFREVRPYGADFAVRLWKTIVELTAIHIQALKVYTKAVPLTTYAQLENSFRKNKMSIYLIALV